jgi:phage terminase Nu1 subunit (DNA packaging protein)
VGELVRLRRWVREPQLAVLLGHSTRTLRRWRGLGLPWHRTPTGGVAYDPDEVALWLEERERKGVDRGREEGSALGG